MAFDRKKFDDIIAAFTVDAEQLREVAADFRHDMRLGLAGSSDASLRMLPSYLGLSRARFRRDECARPALSSGGRRTL